LSIYDKDLLGNSRYDRALMRIREFCTGKRVLCAFSGGKDSQSCYHLLQDAGITFTAQYSITRFEPPELIRFIRSNYPDVSFRRAYKMPLSKEIELRGLPNRWARWCCGSKHQKTEGFDIAVIGVRWAESAARRENWRMFGIKPDKSAYICPIVEWTDADVWEYLSGRPHCSLYDEGYKRIGCVCCPLSPEKMKADSKRWPKTAAMLKYSAYLFCERMKARGYVTAAEKKCSDWSAAENPLDEYFDRWINTGQTAKPIEQMSRNNQDDADCTFAGSGFGGSDDGETEGATP